MKKEGILGIVLMLLFLVMPVASAHIEIIDMGTVYDGEAHYGYVDYQNTEDYNLSGVISVFIDGAIVSEKPLDMPIRYVVGFRCSPVKALDFPLNDTEGDHTIAVYIRSQNVTAERSYGYYADKWGADQDEEETEVEEVEIEGDWMKCP